MLTKLKKIDFKKLFFLIKEHAMRAEISSVSVQVAFYLLLSLFPLVIMVGNLLPFLNIDPIVVIRYMNVIVPDLLQPVLEPIVQTLLTSSNGGLLSISVLGLVWSASKGVNVLQNGLNKAYGVTLKTSFITKRIISLFTVMLLFLLLVVFMLVFGFGSTVLNWLAPVFDWAQPLHNTLREVRWPAVLIFVLIMLVLVYVIAPDAKVSIRQALPGSFVGTLGLVALAEGFAIYARFANSSFTSYGALSTFFILMFWLNYSAKIVIFGAVLNAALYKYRCGEIKEEARGIDTFLKEKTETLQARLIARRNKKMAKKEQAAVPKTADTKDKGAEK